MGPDRPADPGTPALRLPTRALVVLVGASSAGKSTWASAVFRAEQVVSTDALRAMVGESADDQRAGTDAFDLLDRIVGLRLGRRLLTVIDSTGLQADRRRAWVSLAHHHDLPAIAVVLAPPATTIRARNRAKPRPLPAAVLARQLRAAEALTPGELQAEGFDRVEVLTAMGEGEEAPAAVQRVRIVPPDMVQAPDPATTEDATALRFGLQIPRFDPAPDQLAGHLADVARAAETAGFTSLWLMDHVMQIPQVGRAFEDMLEPYTTLGFLAGVTSRIRLGTLVTGITYRNIPHLAKIIATLDVVSQGRAIAGLGAAWFEREHRAYGWDFPDVPGRYALLRDALELLPRMWGPGTPSFTGRTTTVPEAICYPRPLQEHVPILIGGSGERTTLRLVAEHADACNLFGDVDTVARKVAVLRQHCADVGRDPAEVDVTTLGSVLAATDADVLAQRLEQLTPAGRAPETVAESLGAGTIEDQIGRFRAYAQVGVTTAIISLPALDADRVAELEPLVRALS